MWPNRLCIPSLWVGPHDTVLASETIPPVPKAERAPPDGPTVWMLP